MNVILSREARALADEFLEKNQQFAGASLAPVVDSARSILESIPATP